MRLTVLREVLLQSLAKSEQAENLLFIYIKNQSYIIVVFGVMVYLTMDKLRGQQLN